MESISRVIKQLMISEPYYGLFACSLNKRWNDKIPTMGVGLEGLNFVLYINKDFWNGIDNNEKYGTIKHELLHLAFFHVTNMEQWKLLCKDHNILNIAMDLEVQSYIDTKYWGSPEKYAAEAIFTKYPPLKRCKGTKYYIEFLKNIQDTPKGQNASFDLDSGEEEKEKHDIYSQTVQDIKDIMGMGSKDDHSVFGNFEDTSKDLVTSQLEYQLKETYEQVIKSRGDIPFELKRQLESLMQIKPPVFNWKAYLHRMLGFSYDIHYKKTRRKESNRFEESYGLKHMKKHSILVAIDTSASVSKSELDDFFSEIHHIWKAGSDVDIIECDAEIANHYMYKGKTPEFVSGGGGTSFIPCIDYYNNNRKKYNIMVFFTDGYGDQNNCKPYGKVLWIISSNGYQSGEYPGYKICIPKK